ncbi:hypothetical protein D3C72_2214950 [compost metagenome]
MRRHRQALRNLRMVDITSGGMERQGQELQTVWPRGQSVLPRDKQVLLDERIERAIRYGPEFVPIYLA